MIGYLRGEILESGDGKLLVGVGDKDFGMVGYSVSVPQGASSFQFVPGQKTELFIYTHVREDSFDLYGFGSVEDKALFLTLLTVNGIGPRSALGMLSGVEPHQLIDAIVRGDQGFLTRVPGIGKKTAERVVVELRDSVRKKVEAGILTRPGKNQIPLKSSSNSSPPDVDSDMFRDAKDAMIGLGYREQDIHALLNRVLESEANRPTRAEELVRAALRQVN